MNLFTKKDLESSAVPDLGDVLSAPARAAAPTEQPIPVPKAALTPEVQAYINTTQAATIRDMIREVFRELAPTLQSIALTPEKIQAMEDARRAPSADAVARKEREKREKATTHRDIEAARKNLEATQNACAHRYPNGQLALATIGNRPDRQKLLVCLRNHCIISPRM